MPSHIFSGALAGLDAKLVQVELDVSHGLRSFTIVGLPDTAVKESKERIESALKSSGLASPGKGTFKILVNLAPADLKKEGSYYDLPIALAFLIASKQTLVNPTDKLFLGELSLDGKLRPIKGALSFAAMAKNKGFGEIILPKANAREAALIEGIKVVGVESLGQTLSYIEGREPIDPALPESLAYFEKSFGEIDIGWIKGQEYAKRALEITAAGGHNVFFTGPPGGGKSLLAKSLPSIMPSLTLAEALEITKIYSIAGLLPEDQTIMSIRPFRSPHHVSSDVALIGGGNPPRPGEITLAHRGVLFLDEFPEFHRDVLESLRGPIEEGKITVSRAKHTFTFPSRFTLVGASNPCPCGFYGNPDKPCSCSPSQVAMYRRKLSGPLMDRIDIFIDVPAVTYEKLADHEIKQESAKLRENIIKARVLQEERFTSKAIITNAEMSLPDIKQHCQHDTQSQHLLKKFVDAGKLSARGYHRVLKVARTIADLAGSQQIQHQHIAEALMYRIKE